MDRTKKLIEGATNHGFGNKTDVKNDIFNEESLKNTLNLNESFKVNDNVLRSNGVDKLYSSNLGIPAVPTS